MCVWVHLILERLEPLLLYMLEISFVFCFKVKVGLEPHNSLMLSNMGATNPMRLLNTWNAFNLNAGIL